MRCGRTFETTEFTLYGRQFPGDRYCGICREIEEAETDQRRIDVLLHQSGIPAQYSSCSLSNFITSSGNATAVATAGGWAKNFRKGEKPEPTGLLFEGPPGAGKTHLAVGILREVVIRTFARSLFLNVPEWLNRLRASLDASEGPPPPSPRGFELVVIDDLGAEQCTTWSRDQVYSVLNHREANLLPTIVTTNLSPSEMEARLGRASSRRLYALCRRIRVDPVSRNAHMPPA